MASEPFNIKKISSYEDKIEILTLIDELPPFDYMDYQLPDEEQKLVEDVEKLVRNSFEYHQWVQYLRKYMNMNQCAFFSNINNIDTNCIKIHLHHSPITLMEIVVTVLEKRKFYRENLMIEAIAKEAMYIHYCTVVGIIPLCETVHELVHNQFLFVPNTSVMGNYNWFIDIYDPWIPTQVKNKLSHIEEYTKYYNEEDNKNPIKTHYIYLELGDNGIGYNLPKLEDVKKLVEQKINYIRSNGFQSGPIDLVTMDPRYYNKGGNI